MGLHIQKILFKVNIMIKEIETYSPRNNLIRHNYMSYLPTRSKYNTSISRLGLIDSNLYEKIFWSQDNA